MVEKQFQDYQKSAEDKTRHGQPAKLKLTLEQDVRALLAEGQWFIGRTILSLFRVSKMYNHRIVMKDRDISKFQCKIGGNLDSCPMNRRSSII